MKCIHRRNLLNELENAYQARLSQDFPNQDSHTQRSIIRWLFRDDLMPDELTPNPLKLSKAADYRYRILQRYLEVEPIQAYCNLVDRLGPLVMLHTKASLRQDKRRAIAILSEVLQEILQERVIRQQMDWIVQCTQSAAGGSESHAAPLRSSVPAQAQDKHLQNALLLSSLEEYCLQSVCNQPLVIYKLCTFLNNRCKELGK